MTLTELNYFKHNEAVDWFMQTCTSSKWCDAMAQARPFNSVEQVKATAENIWSQMDEDDILEAFKGHPMIGDISSLREKYANTKALAANEQSGASVASDEVLHALKQSNIDYLEKHGFIFIICATGLSAQTMLAALETRLPNTTEQELATAAGEQIKITLLRIEKGLSE